MIPGWDGRREVAPYRDEIAEGLADFKALAYTIGGTTIYPGNVSGAWAGRKMTINQAAGTHPKILDRMDLRLECIRRHYIGQPSPLGDVLARYADFFALFGDFDGYLTHFLLQDFAEGGRVRFVLPFDDFVTRPVPRDAATYRGYMARSSEPIRARNERIAAWAVQHLPSTI